MIGAKRHSSVKEIYTDLSWVIPTDPYRTYNIQPYMGPHAARGGPRGGCAEETSGRHWATLGPNIRALRGHTGHEHQRVRSSARVTGGSYWSNMGDRYVGREHIEHENQKARSLARACGLYRSNTGDTLDDAQNLPPSRIWRLSGPIFEPYGDILGAKTKGRSLRRARLAVHIGIIIGDTFVGNISSTKIQRRALSRVTGGSHWCNIGDTWARDWRFSLARDLSPFWRVTGRDLGVSHIGAA